MDDLFVLDIDTEYEKQLNSIGRRMLLEYDLVIGDKHYDMLEVEAYLNAPGHPDPFVHAHPFQKRSGYWVREHVICMSNGSYADNISCDLLVVFSSCWHVKYAAQWIKKRCRYHRWENNQQ